MYACMNDVERISFKIFEQETQGLLSASLQAAARLCKFSLNSHKWDCSQTNCSRKKSVVLGLQCEFQTGPCQNLRYSSTFNTQTVKYNDNQLLNKVQTKIIFSFKNYIHHHHFSKLYLLRPYKKEPRLHKRMYPLFHHTHLSILYANGSETCDKLLPAAIPPCI